MEVERISIGKLVTFFIGYIIIHIIIGLVKSEKEKQLKETPEDEELKRYYKWSIWLFKWFPGIYVLLLLLMLA